MRNKNPLYTKADKLFQSLSQGKRCLYCTEPADCMHHVVGRSNIATRWLPDNGQAVCIECHNAIHNGNLKEKPILDYVRELGHMNFKTFLVREGITKKDFIKEVERKLNEIIRSI